MKTDSLISRYSFIVSMFLVFVFTYARDNLGIKVPIDLFTLILGPAFLFYKKRDFIAFCAIEPLIFNGIRTVYVFAIAIIIYLLKFGLKSNRFFFMICMVLFLELSHILIDPFDWGHYFGYFVTYMFLGILIHDAINLSYDDSIFVMKAYVISFMVIMVDLMQIFVSYHGNIISMLLGGNRFGDIDNIHWYIDLDYYISINANTIAMLSLFAISISLVCYNLRCESNKIFWLCSLYISMFFGLATGSRTFFMALGIIFLIWLFFIKHTGNKSNTQNVIAFIVIACILYIGINYADLMIDNIFNRFKSGESTTGHRDEIFEVYTNYMFDNAK